MKLPQSFIKQHPQDLTKALTFILNKDPSLFQIIVKERFNQFDTKITNLNQAFIKLVDIVIGQQISTKAAISIRTKFWSKYIDKDTITITNTIINSNDEDIRECGLSIRKISYIKSIAQSFLDKQITMELLENGSNQDIIDKLMVIKGIGRWSCIMFLINLHKQDVFTDKDLGLKRGFQVYAKQRGLKQDILSVADEFKPFRTSFMFILWRLAHMKDNI